jgi:glycerol-3-phosphate O-acyltransferase
MQTLERYFLTLSRLINKDSNALTATELEDQCTQVAQRISILYGINAPEFFDKALFRTLIQELISNNMLRRHENGTLIIEPAINTLSEALEQVLDGALRQSILRSL